MGFVSHLGDMADAPPSPRWPSRTALLVACLAVASALPVLAQAPLSPSVAARLALTPAGERVNVYAVLRTQASGRKLRASLLEKGMSRVERSGAVMAHVKNANEATQAPLVAALRHRADVTDVRPHWIVNVVAFSATPAAVAELARRPEVRAVNLDLPWVFESATASATAAVVPDGSEPGLRAINAPAMWARGYTGFGGVALTADTGVDPFHPAIGHKFAGHDGRAAPWFASEAYPVATDCGDHGTHVNGTIMGLDRLANDTIGVAPGAHWLGAAILCGTGTGDNLEAFEWALDPDADAATSDDRPFVINNSWYDPGIEDIECTAANPYPILLDNLEAAGVAVVFSAGNNGPDARTITPPHSYNATVTNAFTVGALSGNREDLRIADFSSRGPATCSDDGAEAIDIKPEVSAPGVDVRSCLPGGGYGLKSGTSMAAPHTAGAALLLHEAFPELDGDAVLAALYYSARDLGEPGEDNTYGRGIIDVDAAYAYLIDQGHAPSPPARPASAVDVVAVRSPRRSCSGTIEVALTLRNTGTAAVSSIGYEVRGHADAATFGEVAVALAPASDTTVVLPVAYAAAGERVIDVRVVEIDGAPADPRLDLGASVSVDLSRTTEPVLTLDRAATAHCLGSPVTLTLAKPDYADPAVVHFDVERGFEDFPAAAGEVFTIDELRAPVTLYGRNEYRRRGGATLPENTDALPFLVERTSSISFATERAGLLRSVAYVQERPGRVQLELYIEGVDAAVAKYNRANGAGVVRASLSAELLPDRRYRLDVISTVPLAADASQRLAEAPVAEFISFGEVEADDPIVGDGSSFLFEWTVGYYDGCRAIPVTLAPDTSRTASEREVGLSVPDPAAGVPFDAFDATGTDGTAYAWSLDGVASPETGARVSLTAQRSGDQAVRMSLLDGEGCATAAEATVTVAAESSSTQEVALAGETFRLWPNPTAAAFSIEGPVEDIAEVVVLDAAGRTVQTYATAREYYPVAGLPAGTYVVRVIGWGGASRGYGLEVVR